MFSYEASDNIIPFLQAFSFLIRHLIYSAFGSFYILSASSHSIYLFFCSFTIDNPFLQSHTLSKIWDDSTHTSGLKQTHTKSKSTLTQSYTLTYTHPYSQVSTPTFKQTHTHLYVGTHASSLSISPPIKTFCNESN